MKIRNASSIVMVDRRHGEPRVLMGRRAAAHVFMPNVYVFPGGRVDYADRFVPFKHDYTQDTLDLLMQKMRDGSSVLRARMLGVAAIRETFEEVGLAIGFNEHAARPYKKGSWSGFFEKGYIPDLSRLHFLARAITPPGQKRRFDTRFFIVDISDYLDDQTPQSSSELEDVRWVTTSEALDLSVHFITGQILMAADKALKNPHFGYRALEVPFYRAKPGAKGKAKLLIHLRAGAEASEPTEIEFS